MDTPRQGSTKATEIAELLRGEILSLQLKPGERLRSAPLRERYGVSLSVVREALTRLAESGLVIATPQTGFAVMQLDEHHLEDLTRVRREVETLALRWSMERDDIEWKKRLIGAAYALAHTPRASQTDPRSAATWSLAHEEFHAALAGGCGSPLLLSVRQNLFSASELYRMWSRANEAGEARDIAHEHQAIADAALAGAVDLAAALLDRHINMTTDLLLRGGQFSRP